MADRTPLDIAARGRLGRAGAGGMPQESDVGRSLGVGAARSAGMPLGPAQVVVFPPYQFPPPGAQFFNLFGNATVTNAAKSIPAGLSFNVPSGAVAVIRGLTLNVNTLTASSDVRFDLLVNGAPPPGWGNLTIFPRPATSVSASWDSGQIVVQVPDGGTVQLQLWVGAGDGASYLLGGTVTGWYYSKTIEEQFAGAVR